MKKTILPVLFITILFSCAYYNTFFLTKKYFNDGFNYRKKNFYAEISSDEKSAYSKSLNKASFLFRYYLKSKWVDDALLIVGKIFYFRKDYFRALTKFNELINNYPNSKLITQAYIWKARTLIATKDYSNAEKILLDNIKNKITKEEKAEILYELGNIYFIRGIYSIAYDYYRKSIDGLPKYLKIFGFLKAGDCAFYLSDYKNAISYYKKGLKASNEKNFYFTFNFKLINAYFYNGETDKSNQLLNKILKELQFLEEKQVRIRDFDIENTFNKTLLLKGKIELNSGNYNKAINTFEELITRNEKDSAVIEANYILGNFYLYQKEDFKTAKFFFNKISNIQKMDIVDSAKHKIELIDRILKIKENLSKIDLAINLNAIDYFKNSYPNLNLLNELRLYDSTFFIIFPNKDNSQIIKSITEKIQDIKLGKINQWKLSLAEMYLIELKNIKKAMQIYEDVVNDKNSDRNTKAIATFYIAWINENYLYNNKKAQKYYNILIDKYYNSDFVLKILNISVPAKDKDINSVHSTELKKIIESYINESHFDSALALTEYWANNYKDSVNQPIILFKLGYIFNYLIERKDIADSLYNKLLTEYPSSNLAFLYKQSKALLEQNNKKIDSITITDSTKHTDSTQIKDSTIIKPDSIKIDSATIQQDSIKVPNDSLKKNQKNNISTKQKQNTNTKKVKKDDL